MKRKHASPGRFLVLINLAWFALFALAMLSNGWQYQDRQARARQLETANKELRWKSYVTARAEARIAMLPELQFLANTMATRDRDLYAISRAAWKYGPELERWPEVRNGPALVLAIVHRESNFDPRAQSYDQDGQPLARGAGQINMRVWKLDGTKIDDPDYNISHAVKILDGCLTTSGGSLADALFRYWGGDRDRHSYAYPARVLESKYFDATKHLVYQDNAVLK